LRPTWPISPGYRFLLLQQVCLFYHVPALFNEQQLIGGIAEASGLSAIWRTKNRHLWPFRRAQRAR
jgi:hypothetical protein